MKIATIIRLVATACLLWLAYQETGPWTTIILVLLTTNNEMEAAILNARLRAQR